MRAGAALEDLKDIGPKPVAGQYALVYYGKKLIEEIERAIAENAQTTTIWWRLISAVGGLVTVPLTWFVAEHTTAIGNVVGNAFQLSAGHIALALGITWAAGQMILGLAERRHQIMVELLAIMGWIQVEAQVDPNTPVEPALEQHTPGTAVLSMVVVAHLRT